MTATDPWDIIIHHAGVDTPDAERLYDVLSRRCRVFLDSRSIKVGEAWDFESSRALGAARMSVIVLSRRTQSPDAPAHRSDRHFTDLVGEAIRWNRRQPRAHRVIPVAMDFRASDVERMPFGLNVRHLIQVTDLPDLEAVADRILAPPGAASGGAPPAVPKGTGGATPSALFRPKFGARQRALVVMAALALIVLGLVVVLLSGLLSGDEPGASAGVETRDALFREGNKTPSPPKPTIVAPASPAPSARGPAVRPEASPGSASAPPVPAARPPAPAPEPAQAAPAPAPERVKAVPAPAPEPVKVAPAPAPEPVKAAPAPAPEPVKPVPEPAAAPAAGASEADYFSVHVLKDGENLWKLAHEVYKVDYWLLQDYNKDKDFRRLRPGSRIRVPKTKKRFSEIKELLNR